MPWLAVGAAHRGLSRPRRPVRRRRGHHGRVRRGGGPPGRAGFLLAGVGARQPGRRPDLRARSPGGRARWCGCAWGALGMAAAMVPLVLIDVDLGDGPGAASRGLRDRADPDRRDVAGRAGAAGRPAHRGHDVPAHRRSRRCRARCRPRRHRDRRGPARRRPTWCRSAAACSRSLLPWRLRARANGCRPMTRSQTSTGSSAPGVTGRAGERHRAALVTPDRSSTTSSQRYAARPSAARPSRSIGTGHSFTAIAAPEHTMLLPGGLTGIIAVDRDAMTVTARAGTQLKVLNAALEELGLSLHNMGDIAEQTLAGAISTGTHGTGGRAGPGRPGGRAGAGHRRRSRCCGPPRPRTPRSSTSPASGSARSACSPPSPSPSSRCSCSAPRSVRCPGTRRIATFDEMVAEHDHVDMYWFPHTDRLLLKRNTRIGAPTCRGRAALPLAAPPRRRLPVQHGLRLQTAALNRAPRAIPADQPVRARDCSAPRTYTDIAHRVFTSERRVVFREMEYAVPREAGLDRAAPRPARCSRRPGCRDRFPVEIRVAPADDVPLSTATPRDSLYLAFHTHRPADHERTSP